MNWCETGTNDLASIIVMVTGQPDIADMETEPPPLSDCSRSVSTEPVAKQQDHCMCSYSSVD